MIRVIFGVVFILNSLAIDFTEGKDCITPYKENATCAPISECEIVASALLTFTPRGIQFVKDSKCGCDSGMVCCGTSNDKLYPQLKNCTTVPQSQEVEVSWVSDASICGLDSATDRIKGGGLVNEEEFPWLVALEYKQKNTNKSVGIRCGGSLITERYVLTAAHCISNVEFEIIKVWLGVTNLTSEESCSNNTGSFNCIKSVQKLNVEKIIPHESYNSIEKVNDIGLLKLETAVEFNNYIRPICLISSRSGAPSIGTYFTVAGWGAAENGSTSEVKLKVEVPLKDNKECQDYLSKHYRNITSKQLCVGGERGKDSCEGDSGGPLMFEFVGSNGDIQWIQHGIVSYGAGCGVEGKPSVYTKVASYNRWIINKMSDTTSHLDVNDPCSMDDRTMGTCVPLNKCPATLNIKLTKSEYYLYNKKLGSQCLTPLSGETVICCEKPGPMISPNWNTSGLPDNTTCGILKEEPGVNDTVANIPWMAGIEVLEGNRSKIRCHGTVISSRYVLTIVYCILGIENDTFVPINVWLGRWNTPQSNENSLQKIGIKRIIPYPVSSYPAYNQYTLILLEKEIQFSDYVKPICLNSPNLPKIELGENVTNIWPTSFSKTEPITSSETMFKEELLVIDNVSKEKSTPMVPRGPIAIMRRYEDKTSKRKQWYLVAVHNEGNRFWYTKINGIIYVPNIINSLDWIIATISEKSV